MKTFTTLTTLATSLTQNTSTANTALVGQLISDQHRYLIQKYFDNERSVQFSTIGNATLTLTGLLAIGATSATLSSAWLQPTCQQYVNFTGGQQRLCNFTLSSATITWTVGLTLATTSVSITSLGVQDYVIPANVSKLKDNTINVGQLKYVTKEIKTRQEWDTVNFLPYNSDIPNYYFIYNGKLSIFPIPSTTGNIITVNYKTRVPDLSIADVSDGTINTAGMVKDSVAVTGLGTAWTSTDTFPANTDVSFFNLYLSATPPNGDGIWYPISQFTSDTALVLANPVINAPNITNTTKYVIGQMPLLSEDFHDMIVYGALKTYYSSIVPDANRFKEYDALYQERLRLLEDYAGTKSVNVDLGDTPAQVNPNLFYFSNN